jgi:alcohol ABC transporter permease protein
MKIDHATRALSGIVMRELLRFIYQRERFIAALVRPLVWLLVFAAGFRAALGLSITPPYETYISYEIYIVPGLAAMIQLFNGMQSSLSMVYDREMGSMRVLLTSPLPRLWPRFTGSSFQCLDILPCSLCCCSQAWRSVLLVSYCRRSSDSLKTLLA